MSTLWNNLLDGNRASDLVQVPSQVARHIVICMTTQELHVIYADEAWATVLAAGLLLAVVMARRVKPLTWLRA